jgi:putative nucleotidyltransferase with HDIG domain
MNPAVAFLQALAQAMSATMLYMQSHPARARAVNLAFERLRVLQGVDAQPCFSFLGRDVIYGQEALRDLRDWQWAEKCAAAGVQRIEVLTDVSREDFEAFVDEIHVRLADAGSAPREPGEEAGDDSRPPRQAAIRFGEIAIQQGGEAQGLRNTSLGRGPTADGFTLREEADAVRWIHGEVTGGGTLPLLEAEGVVRSLAVALHADGRVMIPLLRIKAFDQYTTTHSLNVSILAMALAEALGHVPRDVRAIGSAGLLHDLGKVRVPQSILTKPGPLSPEERELLDLHPADGARIILNSDSRLSLQAAVAFEHHVMLDGGGYPRRHFTRDCHHASMLIHICDVYDALRTERPYRPAWAPAEALAYIERRSGKEFDPAIAEAFASLIRRHEREIGHIDEDQAVDSVAKAA